VIVALEHALRLRRLVKFCLVGASGVAVDMAVLHLLASPSWRQWDPTLSKLFSAEAALLNNFLWNEVWTFGPQTRQRRTLAGVVCRLWRFHAICGLGIGWAVLLLHLFYACLGMNLYLGNLLVIGLVTLWNFYLNARFNWRIATPRQT
jgi:dolichol-phosphate mannosyltransferase